MALKVNLNCGVVMSLNSLVPIQTAEPEVIIIRKEKRPALPDASFPAHLHPFIQPRRAMGWPVGPKRHTICSVLSPHINLIEKYEHYNLISATHYTEQSSRSAVCIYHVGGAKRWCGPDPIYLSLCMASCMVHILNI